MSFTRNPKKFDVKRKNYNTIYKSDINAKIGEIEDVMKKHRYYDRQTRKKLKEKIEMVEYYLEHPKLHKNVKVDKVVNKIDKIAKQVPKLDIDLNHLRTIETVG